jgi:hypothetical protein
LQIGKVSGGYEQQVKSEPSDVAEKPVESSKSKLDTDGQLRQNQYEECNVKKDDADDRLWCCGMVRRAWELVNFCAI